MEPLPVPPQLKGLSPQYCQNQRENHQASRPAISLGSTLCCCFSAPATQPFCPFTPLSRPGGPLFHVECPFPPFIQANFSALNSLGQSPWVRCLRRPFLPLLLTPSISSSPDQITACLPFLAKALIASFIYLFIHAFIYECMRSY